MISGEQYIEGNPPLNSLVEIYFTLRGKPNVKGEDHFQSFLFYYEDAIDNFKCIFKNWFKNIEKLKPTYKFYLTSLYSNDMYLEYKFLSLIQAIESYHRVSYKGMDKYVSEEEYNNILGELNKKIDDIIPDRNLRSVLHSRLEYGNEHSLRKRFDKLFKENYKKIFNVSKKKIDNFIEGVIKTRNYLIHQDHRLKDNSYRDEEYFNAIDILKTLIEIIVLKEIGFEESQIKIFYQNRIKNNNLNIDL